MWDVFEQSWTLLAAAVLVLLVVLTIRGVLPEKRRFWQWLLPLGVAALAFGLDAAVATDLEQINGLLKAGIQAAQTEDCAVIGRLLSPDYADSYHKSKEAALAHCRSRLVPPAIEHVHKIASEIKITPPEAVATFNLLVRFEDNSVWARSYKPTALVVIQFHLRRQADGAWLVRRAEIVEVDTMSGVGWGLAQAERDASWDIVLANAARIG